jgi:hypothetical protein
MRSVPFFVLVTNQWWPKRSQALKMVIPALTCDGVLKWFMTPEKTVCNLSEAVTNHLVTESGSDANPNA